MVRHNGSANTATLQTPPDLCPSEEQLIAFGLQSLPAESHATISTHVSNCQRCELLLSAIVEKRSRSPAAGTVHDSVDNPVGRVQIAAAGDHTQNLAAPADELTAPLRLGNYRLCERLGRGGMGVVYRAVHELLKREVAIKLLPLERVADKQGISRLKREMQAAGNVQHEHVVYATDAGESAGVYYLVMQLIDGLDVGRLLQKTGPLRAVDACEIIRQAAQGLDHIFSRQLVHRDLKPSNLMLTSEGVVKIMDLGLARLRKEIRGNDELTSDKYVLGTADYVAPEQAKDARHADVRSDIYSLGCTLFKLLAGRAPFSGEEYDTFTKKVLAHHGTPAPPIEDLRSDVSPEVAAVLVKMLAKSPDDRYQTPNELGLALAPLSAGANLKALIASALAAPALEAAERDPSTDSQDLKKRETTGFRQTPTPYAASRPTASISLLRRAAIVSAGVVLVAAIALISFSLGGWTTRSPSGDTVVQGNAKVPSDLLSSGRTIGWPGQIGLPVFVPDTKHKLITMTSEMHHLVQFGEIRRGKQQISVDVQFTDETAWAGVFLGYRTEIVHGRPQAMFQLVHFRNSSKSEGKRTYRLSRQSVRLADFNRSLEAQMEDEIILISGVRPTFHLDLLFDQEGIAMIRVDNKEYPELLHANFTNGRDFDPNECWGRWGLYNCGPTTRFFNLEWKGLP